ncbi:hypothetical protein [Nocardia uniformis]|nr:hypothetical protein [Nocardia uniformis]
MIGHRSSPVPEPPSRGNLLALAILAAVVVAALVLAALAIG